MAGNHFQYIFLFQYVACDHVCYLLRQIQESRYSDQFIGFRSQKDYRTLVEEYTIFQMFGSSIGPNLDQGHGSAWTRHMAQAALQALLSKRADPQRTDSYGRTAVDRIPLFLPCRIAHKRLATNGPQIKWVPNGPRIKWAPNGPRIKWAPNGSQIKWAPNKRGPEGAPIGRVSK